MAFVVTAGPLCPTIFQGMTEIGRAGLWVKNIGHNCNWHRLTLEFQEPRGKGARGYDVEIQRNSFKDLAEAMIRTDREAAIKAFGAALQSDATQENVWWPGAPAAESAKAA